MDNGWREGYDVTEKFSCLTTSILNRDLRLPIIPIPSPMGDAMSSEIAAMLDTLMQIFDHMCLLLFDRECDSFHASTTLSVYPPPPELSVLPRISLSIRSAQFRIQTASA